MMRKLTPCLAYVALGIASAATSYTIEVTHPLRIGDAQLKPGEYELRVKGNQAILRSGKSSIFVPVAVEKEARTIRYTIIETVDNMVYAIHLGGTEMKLVFQTEQTTPKIGE